MHQTLKVLNRCWISVGLWIRKMLFSSSLLISRIRQTFLSAFWPFLSSHEILISSHHNIFQNSSSCLSMWTRGNNNIVALNSCMPAAVASCNERAPEAATTATTERFVYVCLAPVQVSLVALLALITGLQYNLVGFYSFASLYSKWKQATFPLCWWWNHFRFSSKKQLPTRRHKTWVYDFIQTMVETWVQIEMLPDDWITT